MDYHIHNEEILKHIASKTTGKHYSERDRKKLRADMENIQGEINELFEVDTFIKLNVGGSHEGFDGNMFPLQKLDILSTITSELSAKQSPAYIQRIPKIHAANDLCVVFEHIPTLFEGVTRTIGGGRAISSETTRESTGRIPFVPNEAQKSKIIQGSIALSRDIQTVFEGSRLRETTRAHLDIFHCRNIICEDLKDGIPLFLIHDVVNMY